MVSGVTFGGGEEVRFEGSEEGWPMGVFSPSDPGSGLRVGDIIVEDGDAPSRSVGLLLSEPLGGSNDGNGGSGEGGRFIVTGKSLFLNRISSSTALLLPRAQLITPSPSVWYL